MRLFPNVTPGSCARSLVLLCLVALTACEGTLMSPTGEPPAPGPTPDDVIVAPLPKDLGLVGIRRLSRAQYQNAIRQLFPGALGATLTQAANYPGASPRTGLRAGFTTDSDNGTVSTSDEVALEDSAEAMADAFLANATTALPQLCPSLGSGFTDAQVDACVPGFIDGFGRRAFRRPLTDAERTTINGLYTSLRTGASMQSAREAFSAVLQYFFQAPAFIYRPERGTGDTGIVTLTAHELATRLAFLLTDAPPDDALLAAADDGSLSDPAVLRAQAERLLDTAGADAPLARFIREWLRIDLLETLDDADPDVPGPRRDAMLAEVEALTRSTWSPSRGTLRELFSTQQMAVNQETDDTYGVPAQSGAAFTLVNQPNRRGVLSSAGFLVAHAPSGHQVPILRGSFLRKEVLCQPLGTLPGNIDINAPLDATRNAPTARERLAPTSTRSECAGCHSGINPLGFALEAYDAQGRFRTTENGATIDTSGAITFPNDEEWDFANHDAFLAAAAQSPMTQACASQRFFHFALGRQALPEEAGFLADLRTPVTESGGTVQSLVLPLLASDTFTSFRREP